MFQCVHLAGYGPLKPARRMSRKDEERGGREGGMAHLEDDYRERHAEGCYAVAHDEEHLRVVAGYGGGKARLKKIPGAGCMRAVSESDKT
jgi:hypothetical protein